MVSSKTIKTISLAISLLAVVISLTGTALAATAPNVANNPTRYTPGFAGAPGKMATDAAGNLYVADFWAKGVVKLDRLGSRIGFIPTTSRPTAVAVMPDNRLVVAMSAPQAKVAFYSQSGSAPNVTGEELTATPFGAPAKPYYRPSGIAMDASGNIFVLDAGDLGTSTTDNVGCVRVYDSTGVYRGVFGTRTPTGNYPTVGGEFKQPMGIAYEKANGQIVVADTMNTRLQFFTWNGSAATYVRSVGSNAGKNGGAITVGSVVKFAEPFDVSFDYSGSALNRIYVAERARGEISVVDPANGNLLKLVSGTTVTGGTMKFPGSILFKAGATGGVLYAGSDATDTGINLLAFGVDSGTVPTPTVALAITSSVPPTTTTGQSPLTVSGTVSPVVAVNCSVNGGADTLATPSGGNWDVSLTLQSGYNYILCKATSGGVTTYAEASTYYTGTPGAAPVPVITSPLTGIYTNNATVTVSGTTTVPNASMKLTNANNGAVVSAASGSDSNWSATIALAEGANAITVDAWKAGTAIGTASVTVNADFTPPNMAGKISFLANGATTVAAVQNLDGIVVEKNLSSIVVNGNVVEAKVALPATDSTYFSIPVSLVRGSNTIAVTATDLAGNSSTVTRTPITLNPEIPGLTVALPADNSYATGAGTTSANGAVDPIFATVNAAYTLQADGTTPNADGVPATLTGGNWSTASMAIAAGFKSYQFTASGGSTPISEKRTINADAAYAQLAITNPPADLATSASSVNIAGTVAPGSSAPTISVNGGAPVAVSSYVSGTGAFSHPVALGLEGTTTTVKIIADASTAAIRNIIHDSTSPVMAIQANANLSPSIIAGTLEPSAKLVEIKARISGVDTPLPLNLVTFNSYSDQSVGDVVWHANVAGYSYSAIKFTTHDPAGNPTVRTFVNGIPTGDVDGDGVVRLSDAMATLRHVAGTETLSGSELDNSSPRYKADVGSLVEERAAQDGIVTIEDAHLILLKAYGLKTF